MINPNPIIRRFKNNPVLTRNDVPYPVATVHNAGIVRHNDRYIMLFSHISDLDDSAFKDLVDRVKGWITDGGGQVAKVNLWGKRKLAYPVRKQNEGQYVLMKTQMSPAFCSQLERNLRLQEPVLRFLVSVE